MSDGPSVTQALNAVTLGTDDNNNNNNNTTNPSFKAHIALLATASRTDEQVRRQLATPGTLISLVKLVEITLPANPVTATLVLRCIGNAAIDNVEARNVLADQEWAWAIKALTSEDEEVRKVVLKVLYNACAEHEAAQQKCYRSKIYDPLLSLHNSSDKTILDGDEESILAELLLWIIGHKPQLEPILSEPLAEASLHTLLRLPHDFASHRDNVEDFASVVEVCLAFARDATVQAQMIELQLVEKLGQVFLDLEALINSTFVNDGEDAEDNIRLLKPLSTSLLWCLSDTSANILFFPKYDLEHPWVKGLLDCLAHLTEQQSSGNVPGHSWPRVSLPEGERVANVACQIIGNILWAAPSETWQSHVLAISLHRPLLGAICATEDVELLHSISGLLMQLSRPSVAAREAIGAEEMTGPAIARLCRHDKKEVQQDGMKLLGALGRDCPTNQAKFGSLARELMSASNSPTHPDSRDG